MFQKIGGLFDRAWLHGLAIAGTIGLALVSAFSANLTAVSMWLTILLAVMFGVMSVVGTAAGVWRYEKRREKTQSQVLTGLRGTLIPAAEHFITVAPTLDESTFADAVTDLTTRCAQFVKSEDVDAPDANVYLLRGETALSRVNRSGGTGRAQFVKTRARDARSREESAVVDRVLAAEITTCDDTQSADTQRELCLEPKKDRKYRAFISVPILLDGKPVGMISVNSARKDHLTEVHVAFLENTAVLVSALLAVKAGRNVGRSGQGEA